MWLERNMLWTAQDLLHSQRQEEMYLADTKLIHFALSDISLWTLQHAFITKTHAPSLSSLKNESKWPWVGPRSAAFTPHMPCPEAVLRPPISPLHEQLFRAALSTAVVFTLIQKHSLINRPFTSAETVPERKHLYCLTLLLGSSTFFSCEHLFWNKNYRRLLMLGEYFCEA